MTKTQKEAEASPPEMAHSTCELMYTDPARRWRWGSLEGVWARLGVS